MIMKSSTVLSAAIRVVLLTALMPLGFGQAADFQVNRGQSGASGSFFSDTVLARGQGLEVTQAEVDKMFDAYLANRAAQGQAVPESSRQKIVDDILDKIILTKLLLNRATPEDRAEGKRIAEKFIASQIEAARGEEAYRRQLLAVGMSPEDYESHLAEQSVVKAVLDRELQSQFEITPEQIRSFYEENPELFRQPERARIAHILLSTRTPSGAAMSEAQTAAKRELAESLAKRAKAGEDFAKLAIEFSEDPVSRRRGGEYVLKRPDNDPLSGAMAPEFEAMAFALEPGEVSDVISTRLGFHVMKSLQRFPAKQVPLSEVEEQVRQSLLQKEVEKALPGYGKKIKEEAGVKILVAPSAR